MARYIFLSFLVLFLGCSDLGVPTPPSLPDISVGELLAAPETVMVEGKTLTLSTEIWRSFMPISPPDGNPLVALAYIDVLDTVIFPATINADVIWIVYGNEVWASFFTGELPPQDSLKRNRIVRMARNGPKWGPNIYVDVVVRLLDSNANSYLLRAAHQWIGRVE